MKPVQWSVAATMLALVSSGLAQSSTDSTAALLAEMETLLPTCALLCMESTIPLSPCALTDIECICTNEALNAQLAVCLAGNCTVIEQLEAEKFSKTECGASVRNESAKVKAIIWALYSLAVIAVVARLIGRLTYLRSQDAWDDWTILACLIVLTPSSVIAHIMVNSGLGQDIWMLSADNITDTQFYFYIEEYLYTFLVVFTKISILFLYLRIFTTSRSFQLMCWAFVGVVVCFGIGCWVSLGFYCTPVTYTWTMWDGLHSGHCIDINKQTITLAGINMTLDVLIFLLPLPQLIFLKMSWKKKVGVAAMFLVGLFVTLVSVLRLQTIAQWGSSTNPTYDYTNLAIWSLVEIDVGVICACMPGIASLMKRMWPRLLGGSTAPKSSENSNNTIGSGGGGRAGFGRVGSSDKEISKTTSVSVSYKDPVTSDSKSDEVELVEHQGAVGTAYNQQDLRRLEEYQPGIETRNYRSKW